MLGNKSASSGNKSASSLRLRKTWENVRDRHAKDDDRFAWKPPSVSASKHQGQHNHDHGHHHHHHGHHSSSAPMLHHDEGEVDEEEGALLILEQRRKYRAAIGGLRKKYDELEDTIFDSRRPPLLRTTGGEVVQGIYPSASHKWLGVQPRFGSAVPQEKYVGPLKSDLSKWISADKLARIKQETSIFDQPVRAYLKIDDDINVAEMTGSHFRYIDGPSDVDLREQKNRSRNGFELEDGSDRPSGSSQYDDDQERLEDEDSVYDEEEEEEEEEESEYSGSGSGSSRLAPLNKEKDEKTLAALDKMFERHCKNLSQGLQMEMAAKLKSVNSDWRDGQATRPATLRFRR